MVLWPDEKRNFTFVEADRSGETVNRLVKVAPAVETANVLRGIQDVPPSRL